MYTVIRQYTMPDPGAVEEIARRSEAGFVPLIRQAPGFLAWYLVRREQEVLLDSSRGNLPGAVPAGIVLLSISVFETQAQAHASSLLAVDWIREQLAAFLPEAPLLTGGEVVVSTTAAGAVSAASSREGQSYETDEERREQPTG